MRSRLYALTLSSAPGLREDFSALTPTKPARKPVSKKPTATAVEAKRLRDLKQAALDKLPVEEHPSSGETLVALFLTSERVRFIKFNDFLKLELEKNPHMKPEYQELLANADAVHQQKREQLASFTANFG